jgi:CheY-like chemotaxis protein
MPDATRDETPTIKAKVLIVDDDETVRASLSLILEYGDFEVATAASVNDALKLIGSQVFDVLLSDLHMPGAGDGLTVVSAMRHSNPASRRGDNHI